MCNMHSHAAANFATDKKGLRLAEDAQLDAILAQADECNISLSKMAKMFKVGVCFTKEGKKVL